MRFTLFFAILSITQLGFATEPGISDEWFSFQSDPVHYMTAHPPKADRNGAFVSGVNQSAFSRSDIESGDFFYKKLAARDGLTTSPRITNWNFGFEPKLTQKVVSFLDSQEFQDKGIRPLTRLTDIDSRGLQNASLKSSPWSGSYWPIYQGQIGMRYASKTFPGPGGDWSQYHQAVAGLNTFDRIVDRADAEEIDSLSPAEKYDLLLGKPSPGKEGFLTPAAWAEGQKYLDRRGEVESWMGICHGWAPASFMVPRPARTVEAASPVVASPLRFYPADLKGLTSLLWANANVATSYLGERCTSKAPALDPDNGRILDPKCFAINPGLWHLVVINQIALAERSFVIDASYDYEVWNQPMYSYSYRYFNPQTGQTATNASQAAVSKEEYSNDRFKKYRFPEARKFVGVEMSLQYVLETIPNHNPNDSSGDDSLHSVVYLYDLELDENDEIIGGEWYRNQHPNFVWLPAAHEHARSAGDRLINGEWNPNQGLPKFWRDIAIQTAERFNEPLAAILDPLIQAAQGAKEGD